MYILNNIYNHFTLKLKKLALIYASIKREENDIIGIDLISHMNKSGQDAGKYRNKNLVFYIKKDRLNEIFTKMY